MLRLLEQARYEVLPTPTIEEKLLAAVPRDVTVTVTASPTKGLEETLALAERLPAEGYDVVPHVAARMVAGRIELEEIVARLRGAGVTSVFVPGGDAAPAGEYADALALLEDLTALGQTVRARRRHRLPGVAPDHRRRPHRPVDVGQAPARDARRQQPDLRPGGDHATGCTGCGGAASHAAAARPPGPGRPHQAARDGRPRSGSATRPGSWPSTRA